MPPSLRGIVPPLVTPFDADDTVDESAFRREVRYALDAGVSGVVVAGSTGEGTRMSSDELGQVYATAVDETPEDIPVVAGVIAASTHEAVKRGRIANDTGTDYIMACPPPGYFGSQIPDDKGIIDFYTTLGHEIGLPIVLYDVVEFVDVTIGLMERLVEAVPELYGIKVSSDFGTFTTVRRAFDDRLCVMSGLSMAQYPTYSLGADGGIMGINAICPRVSVEIWKAVQAGDYDRARDRHLATVPLIRTAMAERESNFPSGEKAAIDILGRDPGHLRHPFHQVDGASYERIANAIDEMNAEGVVEAPDRSW